MKEHIDVCCQGFTPALLAYSALYFGCLYVFGNQGIKKKREIIHHNAQHYVGLPNVQSTVQTSSK